MSQKRTKSKRTFKLGGRDATISAITALSADRRADSIASGEAFDFCSWLFTSRESWQQAVASSSCTEENYANNDSHLYTCVRPLTIVNYCHCSPPLLSENGRPGGLTARNGFMSLKTSYKPVLIFKSHTKIKTHTYFKSHTKINAPILKPTLRLGEKLKQLALMSTAEQASRKRLEGI